MTRTQRKLLYWNGSVGLALTLLVMALDYTGGLIALERWFYDMRARYCQFYMPPPSDRIVYLGIDDNALERIERWPWKRSTMAEILDEVRVADPKVVFLDIMYSEAQETDGLNIQAIDHDKRLADSIRAAGNVVVPVMLELAMGKERTPSELATFELLKGDLELHPDAARALLVKRGDAVPDDEEKWISQFLVARRRAMHARIAEKLAKEQLNPAELRNLLLPGTDPDNITSPLVRLLLEEHERVEKLRPLSRFAWEPTPAMPPLIAADDENAPLAMFSSVSSGTAFVNYFEDNDGVVRRIPMVAMHRGRVLPQFGLLVACKLMDVDPSSVRFDKNHLIIPKAGGDLAVRIDTQPHTKTGEPIGGLLQIPYFGRRDWIQMYPEKQFVPVGVVWQIIQMRQDLRTNIGSADRGIVNTLLKLGKPDDAEEYAKANRDPDNAAARLQTMQPLLNEVQGAIARFDGPLNDEEKKELEDLKYEQSGMTRVRDAIDGLIANIRKSRENLRTKFAGRAVLVGSVATGSAYDFKPTSLHEKCPGVMIHGVVASGILSGETWRVAPRIVTLLLTFIVGLATTALVIYTSPRKAAVSVVGLALTYLLANGLIVFDRFNIIVGVAAPMVAMMVTWLICQLIEVVVEIAQRTHITKRFRAYVDPSLVEYCIEHPELNVVGGQYREMTVVFTDLAGFTTVSETLKEQVVPLLNEYLGLMTEVIRRHNGFVNKFLGDGIMFFFNAPRDNPNHAADAAATVLEMQPVIVEFNKGLVKRGLPAINMRAGIATGYMTVGDAGGTGHSDYTVIGDNVNLSARLEGANKATGTTVLMTARTAEMFGDKFITRPVAKLQVKGKSEGVITCELLADASTATEDQKALATLSKEVFDHFVAARFAECLAAVDALEQRFGESKFTSMYRAEAEAYLKLPPTNGFDGSIVLHEK